jgi:hypothetical protein
MSKARKDQIADIVAEFQALAEVYRETAEAYTEAQQLMLEGAILFADEQKPSDALWAKTVRFGDRQKAAFMKQTQLLNKIGAMILDLQKGGSDDMGS